MDSQGPTAAVRAGAPTATGGSSRLAQMQMRFQQRQQQERDQRKIEQIATRTSTTTTSVITSTSSGRTTTSSAASAATVELAERLNATSLSSTLGAGKVRQMFDERRHRVAGIDKSYPLQPIQTKATATATANGAAGTNGNGLSSASNNIINNNNIITTTTAATNGLPDGSALSRGVAGAKAAGLNNKTRVPPISANSRPRPMQQQPSVQRAAGGQQLRQDSHVHDSCQARGSTNGGSGDATEADTPGGCDDNDNFLELEKFPDTVSLEGDLLDAINHAHAPPASSSSSGPVKGAARSNGSSRTLPSTTAVQKAATRKPSVTTATSATSMTRSTHGSAKQSGTTAPSRYVQPAKSNGPSRAVTQPSPASSAGSTRKQPSLSAASSVSSGASAGAGMAAANEPVPEGLTRCEICSRNFADDRIEKHRQICQKTKAKKRKVFDITKHRVQGTEAEKYVLKPSRKSTTVAPAQATQVRKVSSQPSAVGSAGKAAAGSKQSNWRKKHEEFIATIRAAKELKAHLAKGGKLSDLPPPPPSENPDYVQCPHCSRRFNQTAAERHIPKCATMLHNKPKPKSSKAAATTVRRY